MKKRDLQVDALKTIAIILVVVGHVIHIFLKYGDYDFLNLCFNIIYIFHMPLFFLLSGFLYNQSFSIANKVKRYVLPIFFFGGPHIIIHLVFHYWDNDLLNNLIMEMKYIIKGGYYWFLLYLFFMYMLSKILYKYIIKMSNYYFCGLIVASMLLVFLSDIYDEKLLFKVFEFLYMYIFFIVGILMRVFDLKDKINRINLFSVGRLFIYMFILTILYMQFDLIIIKPLVAFFACAFLIRLTASSDFKHINCIGKYTMIIYLLDGYLIAIENKIFSNIYFMVPLVIINILLPMCLYSWIIRKSKVLSFLIGE